MKKSYLQMQLKDAFSGIQNKNIEHVDVAFEVKQITESDDFFEFEGYGSTFGNVDLVNDVVLKGAFTESLQVRTPALLWQHDMKMPLGIYIDVKEDVKGLYVKGRMPKEDTFVSGRVVPQMKVGSVNKMSIGFTLESKNDFYMEKSVRYLKRVQLHEISLVTIPANPQADVSSIKNLNFEGKQMSFRDIHQMLSSMLYEKLVAEYENSSKDRPYFYIVDIFEDSFVYELGETLYQQSYMFDSNEETIDFSGEPYMVRRETNYVPLNGSNERNNLPSELKRFTINDVFSIKSKRDLEKVLRESGAFSKSASTFISSFFQESRSDSAQVKSGNTTSLIDQLKSFNAELEK